MITLYGTGKSRASRCLWALEEMGLEYEHVPIVMRSEESMSSDYRALNPSGKVPTLKDGDLVMYESLGINLYLAMTYPGDLWPEDKTAQGKNLQWCFWAAAELENPLVTVVVERAFKPEPMRDLAKADEAEGQLKPRLDILNGHLEKSGPYLTGSHFSIADLNVASVLSAAPFGGIDFNLWPALKAWFDACMARPAQKAAAKL